MELPIEIVSSCNVKHKYGIFIPGWGFRDIPWNAGMYTFVISRITA